MVEKLLLVNEMITHLVFHKITHSCLEIYITLIQEKDNILISLDILDQARNTAMFFGHEELKVFSIFYKYI